MAEWHPNALERGVLRDLHKAARRARSAADVEASDTRPASRRRAEGRLARAVSDYVKAYDRLPDVLKARYENQMAEVAALRLGSRRARRVTHP
jgi:hypothetical protein